jgi:hypothetical protein
MRVVVDANVIVSALITPQGIPSQLFRYWELLYFDMLVSRESLDELARVLNYPKIRKRLRSSDQEIADFLDSYREKAIWVVHHEAINAVVRDISDNIYLEIGVSGYARYVVSGDHHLLELKEFQGIAIVSPAEFVQRMANSTSA